MKKFLHICLVLFSFTALSFLIWMNQTSYHNMVCEGIDVQVSTDGDVFFLDAEMVEAMIDENVDSILGKRYQDINIYLLEEFLDAHVNVQKAELYLTNEGELCVEVEQRKPLARVFEAENSYYLDEAYEPFSLSEVYSARVLQVFWPEPTALRKEYLAQLLTLIEEDAFLQAQITGVVFDEEDEIIVLPRVGNHEILIGKAQGLDKKFENLKVFYKHGLEKVGWDRYAQISLKFENQVVCTKR